MLLTTRIVFVVALVSIAPTPFQPAAEGGGLATVAGISERPYAGVVFDANGNLYTTTKSGNVYTIAKGSNTATLIASSNGLGLFGGVTLDANGNLYGTSYNGGLNGVGMVYEIAKGSNTITTIDSFNEGVNGARPYAGVTFDANGNLWGTTQLGGTMSSGTVYEIEKGTNTITTIASFEIQGQSFSSVTFDANGNLFGTTTYGGPVSQGSVFEIAKGSNTITTIATFNGANGAQPYGSVALDANGNLYGTTYVGGSSDSGTVFEIAKGSNLVTTLGTFGIDNGHNNDNGRNPLGGVTLDAKGNLYGTTYLGGLHGVGTLFEIAKDSNTITTLASFSGDYADGANPRSNLTFDANGNLYGTTELGGGVYNGTVFEFSPTSSVPEPSSVTLIGIGLVVCVLINWHRSGLKKQIL